MYSWDEVEKIVHDAVIETFDLKEAISDGDLSFKDDFNANSLDMVSLAIVLEDEFSAEIEEDQVENFITIDNVVDYVMKRQEKA